MNDMTGTIAPKSDQINADDLIGRTLTICITKVVITGDEQPVAIHFDSDNGKPYRACKSMRRVLVHVWGPDANKYIGRSLTIYRDEKVMFGGAAVGGIRISHMSHIERPVTMALTATRASRKPFTVKPLPVAQTTKQTVQEPTADEPPAWTDEAPPDDGLLAYMFATAQGGITYRTGTEWIAAWRKLTGVCQNKNVLGKLQSARDMNKGAIAAVAEFDPAAAADVTAMLDAALSEREAA